MKDEALFTPDTHIAEAGRAVLAAGLVTIRMHEPALRQSVDVTAVHESRKAIRRTFSAFRLFGRYFEPGVLEGHHRRLRKIMRRLGRSRDAAVFLDKLEAYEAASGPLPGLKQFWQGQQVQADDALRSYLKDAKRQAFLDEYTHFTQTPGLGTLNQEELYAPLKVRHLAPLLIFERMAAARAHEDYLPGASLDQLHQLRIQIKELRYALWFFAPLLSGDIKGARSMLKQLQILLGEVNDAKVALRMLAKTPALETEASLYRATREAEIATLIERFPDLWTDFEAPAWRQMLASALASL